MLDLGNGIVGVLGDFGFVFLEKYSLRYRYRDMVSFIVGDLIALDFGVVRIFLVNF